MFIAPIPGTRLRFVFLTTDLKELTAHLDTLDALQVPRPAAFRTDAQ